MHQTGFKNKAGRTQDFPLYTQERIILDMQNKDIQLSDTTNEEEERGVPGRRKACHGTTAKKTSPEGKKIPDPKRTGETKTATTYSPTCTHYHRRDEA